MAEIVEVSVFPHLVHFRVLVPLAVQVALLVVLQLPQECPRAEIVDLLTSTPQVLHIIAV